jgi:hypothetical protein
MTPETALEHGQVLPIDAQMIDKLFHLALDQTGPRQRSVILFEGFRNEYCTVLKVHPYATKMPCLEIHQRSSPGLSGEYLRLWAKNVGTRKEVISTRLVPESQELADSIGVGMACSFGRYKVEPIRTPGIRLELGKNGWQINLTDIQIQQAGQIIGSTLKRIEAHWGLLKQMKSG